MFAVLEQGPVLCSDSSILCLSWKGRVPRGQREQPVCRRRCVSEGWLATGNTRGVVGVTFTSSLARKERAGPQRNNFNLRGHNSEQLMFCLPFGGRSQGNWTFSAGQGQLKVRKRHGESLKQKITKSCRILPCSYKRPELEGLWKDFRHGAALELIFWLHTCLTSALIFPLILLQGLIPPALAPLPVCSFK
ncbi:hypothetical protein DNTS_031717 [Danionella cerebrum]|uniref:Uncharacterized protein n=1 Tax=Danionella cerebrum TaxID=2873325 RepID=A0A553QB71_9TELE|nr:hypothetical protein DNTS_031717 [Danionella translucida]